MYIMFISFSPDHSPFLHREKFADLFPVGVCCLLRNDKTTGFHEESLPVAS